MDWDRLLEKSKARPFKKDLLKRESIDFKKCSDEEIINITKNDTGYNLQEPESVIQIKKKIKEKEILEKSKNDVSNNNDLSEVKKPVVENINDTSIAAVEIKSSVEILVKEETENTRVSSESFKSKENTCVSETKSSKKSYSDANDLSHMDIHNGSSSNKNKVIANLEEDKKVDLEHNFFVPEYAYEEKTISVSKPVTNPRCFELTPEEKANIIKINVEEMEKNNNLTLSSETLVKEKNILNTKYNVVNIGEILQKHANKQKNINANKSNNKAVNSEIENSTIMERRESIDEESPSSTFSTLNIGAEDNLILSKEGEEIEENLKQICTDQQRGQSEFQEAIKESNKIIAEEKIAVERIKDNLIEIGKELSEILLKHQYSIYAGMLVTGLTAILALFKLYTGQSGFNIMSKIFSKEIISKATEKVAKENLSENFRNSGDMLFKLIKENILATMAASSVGGWAMARRGSKIIIKNILKR